MPKTRPTVSVRRFHDLIPFRVREVLLVSSPYDAFILQEDGHLTEKMFFEYREISLSSSPRFTHASNGEEAIRLLEKRRFDLILAMTSLADMDVNAFGRRVKQQRPGRPVILLMLDRHEAGLLKDTVDASAIDGIYFWSGDNLVLLAIIKSVEDRQNVDHDIEKGNVRIIIVIEDSPAYYSSFLGILYRELMAHSRSLYSEGPNDLYRLMYMKSRPKVLHARSYEEAVELFERYKNNLLAVISDIGIPREGELDPEAGLDFARLARRHDAELPLLLQSAAAENREKVLGLGAAYVDKKSTQLVAEIRDFLSLRLGFGDFILRTPEGQETDRAHDLKELEEKLGTIPEEQLLYHASHNHISIWLMARSEFELAEELRPKRVSDFNSVEEMRQHLISSLRENRKRVLQGVVSDFDGNLIERENFSRIGQGYLGGKARGIAFLYQTLSNISQETFGNLVVKIPQTIVVTTDEFDQFLDQNDLRRFAFEVEDDAALDERFLQGELPEGLVERLRTVVQRVPGPLAVRSSSLLEDSMHQPFAGIYSTLMIPNSAPDEEVRLADLCSAIKLVYASTFSENSKSYLKSTGSRIDEEKMAVIIQRVVGQQFERRFYPHFSGVAQSYNYYPIPPQDAEDGVVHVALGLGRFVVDGGLALRFSPKHPRVIPQFARPEAIVDTTQRGFWALDMEPRSFGAGADLYSTLEYFDLRVAEADGTLLPIGSVYNASDHQIRDDLSQAGPRVITFNNILKHRALPLPAVLREILDITRNGLGCAVEVEFACDMGDWGRRTRRGEERQPPVLYLLQVRPLVSRSKLSEFSMVCFSREETICFSTSSLGYGLSREIRDLIFVRPDRWSASRNKLIAQEVGRLNAQLSAEGRPYVLIGPGRWGTADPWLGIPVKWSQISASKLIVEASPEDYHVDPSQGTHFFHNITAQGIGYITLPPGALKRDISNENYLDWKWLTAQEPCTTTQHLNHLRFDRPLTVLLDGRDGRGVIAKPGVES